MIYFNGLVRALPGGKRFAPTGDGSNQPNEPISNVRQTIIETLPPCAARIFTERVPGFEDIRFLQVC
jgi:hypothetical protein